MHSCILTLCLRGTSGTLRREHLCPPLTSALHALLSCELLLAAHLEDKLTGLATANRRKTATSRTGQLVF